MTCTDESLYEVLAQGFLMGLGSIVYVKWVWKFVKNTITIMREMK